MDLKTIKLLEKINDSGVDICLISKYWDDEKLMEFYNLGYRKFGENRVDALVKRAQQFPSDIEWHFVGNIRSKDLGKICEYATMIQSFDRPDLIEKLSKYKDIEILIQINLVDDKNRNGIELNDLEMVIEKLKSFGIVCNGFMTHPPIEISNERKLEVFNKMNEIFSNHPNYSILSMGTSNDYRLANKCGATLNRLGRILFE